MFRLQEKERKLREKAHQLTVDYEPSRIETRRKADYNEITREADCYVYWFIQVLTGFLRQSGQCQ